ncbi:ornithine decarboxylase-like [Amphiura filiformis]|uniref:ornithine decarboxylase-like n=1 Tax=Amphiura filiformis TaxID=82378 RepID=UPI003B20F495
MADFSEQFKVYEYGRGLQKQKFILERVKDSQDREEADDGFIVFDLGDVIAKQRQWKELLPRVKPFYAVKCRPYSVILKMMAAMGISFDCASKAEIENVLRLGVDPSRIILSHTRKQSSTLEYAVAKHINLMIFDDENELRKIKQIHPSARLLLRFAIYDPTADFCPGLKFGCEQDDAISLLEVARMLNLNVIGVHFHIGTGNNTPAMYMDAITFSRKVFNVASELGFEFTTLDIGGGFPGYALSEGIFQEYAEAVNTSLNEHFPDDDIDIIAEPGQYYMQSAGTIVAGVIGKRVRNPGIKQGKEMRAVPTVHVDYFLNDSLYTSLRDVIYTPHKYHPVPLTMTKIPEGPPYPGVIYGNTCCGTDIIMQKCSLPELDEGDWVYFEDKGDYSHMVTNFNGFKRPFCYYALPDNCKNLLCLMENATSCKFSIPKDGFQLLRGLDHDE